MKRYGGVVVMKSSKIIVIVIVVLGIFLGLVSFFVNSLKKDQLETKKIMNMIVKEYDLFEDQVLTFNDVRDQVYIVVFQDTYYDSLKDSYEKFNNTMQELEKNVDQVVDQSLKLKSHCDTYYSDSSINNKCSTFKQLYEEVMNSFVNDVEKYNELLDDYNDYLKENGHTDEGLLEYKTDKKYIDFNKDKEYSGRE